MHKLAAFLIVFATAQTAVACLGEDMMVLAIVNHEVKNFVFKKGVSRVDFGGSRGGQECVLEADFRKHRATVICGSERSAAELVEAGRSDSFAMLFEKDSHKTAVEEWRRIEKYVGELPVAKGCF